MFNSIGERFNFFSSLCINKIRKMVKAKQQEATELDLIFVGSTLSCIVVTLGTAAFSHYEGNTICSITIIVMSKGMPCNVPTIARTTEIQSGKIQNTYLNLNFPTLGIALFARKKSGN